MPCRPCPSVPFFVLFTKSRVSFIYISISVMSCSRRTAFQLSWLQPGRRGRERRRRSVQPVPGLVRVAKALHTGALLVAEHSVGCWAWQSGKQKGKKKKVSGEKNKRYAQVDGTYQSNPTFFCLFVLNSTQEFKMNTYYGELEKERRLNREVLAGGVPRTGKQRIQHQQKGFFQERRGRPSGSRVPPPPPANYHQPYLCATFLSFLHHGNQSRT